jgi:hypothetical protein
MQTGSETGRTGTRSRNNTISGGIMYIGVGTLVVILLVVLIVKLL